MNRDAVRQMLHLQVAIDLRGFLHHLFVALVLASGTR
jgi:hypothetical protein